MSFLFDVGISSLLLFLFVCLDIVLFVDRWKKSEEKRVFVVPFFS